MPPPKGKDILGPLDVFAGLTNYSGIVQLPLVLGRSKCVAFWDAVNVLQYGQEVSLMQGEMEDSYMNCSVLCHASP